MEKYSILLYNDNKRLMLFKDCKVINFNNNLPKYIKNEIGEIFNWYGFLLCIEMCQYNGKIIYKLGTYEGNNGGIAILFSNYKLKNVIDFFESKIIGNYLS